MYDVIVIGSGPAGLGFATCAARQGLNICVIDPVQKRDWHCTYCTWMEELENSWLNDLKEGAGEKDSIFDKELGETEVVFNDGSRQKLGKRYGRIDGVKLKKMMQTACDKTKRVKFIPAIVNQIDHLDCHSEVSYHNAGEIFSVSARMVVDSSGHYSQFLDYSTMGSTDAPHRGGQRKWQSFYGEELEFDKPHCYDLGKMILFDWRNDHLSEAQKAEVPSFAYILPIDEHTLFIEETVLVSDDKYPVDRLKARLQQRVVKMGLPLKPDGQSVKFVEKYCFPMGGPLPSFSQRIVGVGATARMVHPASGYMIGYTMNAIPHAVAQLKAGLDRLSPLVQKQKQSSKNNKKSSNSSSRNNSNSDSNNSSSADDVSAIAAVLDRTSADMWQSVWPLDRTRLYTIYSMGSDVLTSLDIVGLSYFFHTFFQLPADLWFAFLTRTNSTRQLVQAMVHMFILAPWSIKACLVVGAMKSECGLVRGSLLRAVVMGVAGVKAQAIEQAAD